MNSTWWRKLEDLDDAQKAFILLPRHGRHLLEGPPGSGKANLLLLRAQYLAGSGDKNVLIIAFTNALADFIRNGISVQGLISPTQIRTFHSWAMEHVRQHLGTVPIARGADFDEDTRKKLLDAIFEANSKAPTKRLYSAIFVDEAQDFSVRELESLLCLTENGCICGDARQGIYNKDGLDIAVPLALQRHSLKMHYRIGHAIARVADRLMPPMECCETLEETCNYNPKLQGKSSAKMHECESRDEQFDRMLELLRVQLDAFKDECLGIFCAKKGDLAELRKRFDATDMADLVSVHGVDEDSSFCGNHSIHALTIHSAKGTEFRAVHLYGVEELRGFPLNRRQLGFTAITPAKTALNAYRTGETNRALENAFATPRHIDLTCLFPNES